MFTSGRESIGMPHVIEPEVERTVESAAAEGAARAAEGAELSVGGRKKVVIVGGGPAGMEAARVCSHR